MNKNKSTEIAKKIINNEEIDLVRINEIVKILQENFVISIDSKILNEYYNGEFR